MIVAKWGGSLLTNKAASGEARFRAGVARRLAAEWNRGVGPRGPGLLVHGAGSFGHPLALRHGVGRVRLPPARAGRVRALIEKRVAALRRALLAALWDADLPAVGVPAPLVARVHRGGILVDAAPFRTLAAHGFLPVTGGDVIADPDLGARIVSGDDLLSSLGQALGARRAVFATDVDGVRLGGRLLLEVPPAAAARALARVDAGADATGGMRGKLGAALRLQRAGVETWIVHGGRPGRFADAAAGRRPLGTRLPATRGPARAPPGGSI